MFSSLDQKSQPPHKEEPVQKAWLSRFIRWVFTHKLIASGAVFLSVGLILLAGTYLPLVFASARYYLTPSPKPETQVVAHRPAHLDNQKSYIFARDAEFGIVIPKIHANATIVPGVNPFDPATYQVALTKGVAHAQGTALPSEAGTMFLFAHSAGDITSARQYNAVFYLLDKLKTEDEIFVFYRQQKYRYRVTKTEVVDPERVEFLENDSLERKLILMTCTPAGTTRQRLLVHAEMIPSEGGK